MICWSAPVKGRDRRGYGWCGGLCRWGTTCKLKALDRYAEAIGANVYVGIAADERDRLEKERKPYKIFPLADFKLTEAACLELCYKAGYFWEEDGGAGIVRLYDILDRVSCWCCPLQSLAELRVLYRDFPDLWAQLKRWDAMTWRPFRADYSVIQLEQRFDFEEEWLKAGNRLGTKAFYSALKERLENNGA